MPALLVKINVDDKGNVAIEKLGKNAGRAQPKVKNLGDTMRKAFAVVGVYKGINMLSAKLVQATDEALKFEKAMKKIQAIGNESNKTMSVMSKDIERLALTTEHSFTQVAEAQLGIEKAGIRGAAGLSVLKHSLDLATVAGEEQGAVSEGLINILNAFGMGTEDAGYAANVMSRALNETILNLEEYLAAMKYSAPVAAQLGVSFEELSSIIGILAQTGQRGTLAGTGLRNVLLNMLKLTPATAEALKNVKIEEMGVTQLLETLHDNGLPVVDLLKQFNKRGILAASALGANADAVYDLQNRLTDLSRPLNIVADEMRDNLMDKLQMLNDHFVMIFNTLNERMGQGGDTVIDNLMEKLVDFNEEIKRNPQLIRDWTNVFVGLGNTLTMLVPIIGFMVKHSRELVIIWSTTKIGTSIAETVIAFSKFKKLTIGFKLNPVALGITGFATAIGVVAIKARDASAELKRLKANADKFGRGDVDIKLVDEDIREKAIELNKAYADFLSKANETEREALLGKIKPEDVSKISDVINSEMKRIYDLEQQLEERTGNAFSSNFQEKMNQITELTGAISLAVKETKKLSKEYGSYLTVKPEKEKKKRKQKDDTLGQLFDMHNPQKPYALSPRIEEANQYNKYYETLRRLQGAVADKVMLTKDDIAENKEEAIAISQFYEKHMQWLNKFKEVKMRDPLKGVEDFSNRYAIINDVSSQVMGAIESRMEYVHERQMQIYDEEMEKLQERYELEMEKAGDSALQKSLAENKYQKEKKKIEEKANAERKAYAQKEWVAGMLQIGLNAPIMATNFIVALSKFMGPAAIPTGIALASGVTALQLGVAAANNPADAFFRGGRVEGSGNSTSDSNFIRASKGEWMLSRDDVERLGGDSAIERMITFGNKGNSNSMTVYIDTIIGEETYVRRNILPILTEELKR